MLLTDTEIDGLNTFGREAVEHATLVAKQLRAAVKRLMANGLQFLSNPVSI